MKWTIDVSIGLDVVDVRDLKNDWGKANICRECWSYFKLTYKGKIGLWGMIFKGRIGREVWALRFRDGLENAKISH